MESNEKLLCRKEVGDRLGVSVDTVGRLIDRKALGAVLIQVQSPRRKRAYRSYRVRESELERFIRCNSTK